MSSLYSVAVNNLPAEDDRHSLQKDIWNKPFMWDSKWSKPFPDSDWLWTILALSTRHSSRVTGIVTVSSACSIFCYFFLHIFRITVTLVYAGFTWHIIVYERSWVASRSIKFNFCFLLLICCDYIHGHQVNEFGAFPKSKATFGSAKELLFSRIMILPTNINWQLNLRHFPPLCGQKELKLNHKTLKKKQKKNKLLCFVCLFIFFCCCFFCCAYEINKKKQQSTALKVWSMIIW